MSKSFLLLPFLALMACNAQEKNTLKSDAALAPVLFSSLETNTILADQYGLIYSPALDAVSSETAWVAGETNGAGVILKTEDAGRTWSEQLRVTDTSLDAIVALDARTLWVSGNLGYVAKSSDGGQTWTQMNTGFSGFAPMLSAVDAEHVWVQDDDGIIRTQDGGQSWMKLNPVADLPASILTFRFINRQTGYAIAAVGPFSAQTLFVTHDGGLSWSQVKLPELPVLNNQSPYQALSLSVLNADHIAVASSLGYVYLWDDAGKSFQMATVFNGPQRDIGCFQVVNEQFAYLAAGDDMFVSQDAGKSWQIHKTGVTDLATRCDFTSEAQGILLNTYGSFTIAR